MDDSDGAEERFTELAALEAIFPEIKKHDDPSAVSFSLDLPVHPSNPITVTYPAASGTAELTTATLTGSDEEAPGAMDSQVLAHLPAVNLRLSLPEGYPAERPPSVTISTTPPWLPLETTKKLEEEGPRMWEEMGHNMVAFAYIDHVQQAAENVFGLINDDGTLGVDPRHMISILDYDVRARRETFERETFDCGVCLEPKKGAVCHRMLECGHVFCTACLQDFYKTAITEGDLAVVRCLTPNCAKDRAAAQAEAGSGKRRRVRAFLSPSELLQMGLSQEIVSRYVTLKYKTELESDKNTIYCPRSWCDGAARSKKHKKPEGLELVEVSDDEEAEKSDEKDDKGKKTKKSEDPSERLAICEDCGFAFCSRCFQSWHGEFFLCIPRRDSDEITPEEQASIDYIAHHTTSCPTCGVPSQKTRGCNHMICFRCQTHFCYLCAAWLPPASPFEHYNERPDGSRTGCYMRLWELENGDGNDVGYGFLGGRANNRRRGRNQAVAVPRVREVVNVDDEDGPARPEGDDQQQQNAEVAVALEAPLVLRIGGQAPPRDQQPRGRGRGQGAGRPLATPAPPAADQAARGGRGGAIGRGTGGDFRNGGRRIPVRMRGRLDDALHPADAAWVRNFVEMALNDEENSEDSDDEEMPIVAPLVH
ncbi:RWD-domain-containing protein [Sodiomyces alkalinus F11]|uniref:RBR-type E3 ubiquitin transferase n=1 Tax=Sodiomyces alkalinus (strain CBS 110278 / VKM F-3762 / F11) TaxID=1314773 RepID=A0A3N2Q962_SODAK|nr:RWD-domain-containing protein [Sodiomyces alkalinus F11]ROT43188.1 RWD-domain-containing protein [Sodiomyces alkalinus F11]